MKIRVSNTSNKHKTEYMDEYYEATPDDPLYNLACDRAAFILTYKVKYGGNQNE